MTRDDLFKINGGIVRDLVVAISKYCPKAYVLIISNPVNSTVPIAVEVMKEAGVFDPKKIFGVTTLDVVRAETFVEEITGTKAIIPVVGGHSGQTIVPLFSQTKPSVNIPSDKMDALVNRVQFGGDEVVKAKDGAGSATLSMAYAGFRFAEAVIKASKGEKGIIEPAFVYLDGVSGGDEIAKATGCQYFSVPIELGVSTISTSRLLCHTACTHTSLLWYIASCFSFANITRSHLVPRRQSMFFLESTTTRRSCLRPVSATSRRTSLLVPNSSPTHLSLSPSTYCPKFCQNLPLILAGRLS